MAHWNYRVIKDVVDGEDHFAVHEVYYNDDGSIMGWIASPVTLNSEEPGFTFLLAKLPEAISKPILVKSGATLMEVPMSSQ